MIYSEGEVKQMDFNVDKQQLCTCKIIREAKAEQGIDSDITLPDYCPDIKSILRCSIDAGVNSVNVTGNRITAEGNALIRLVYVSTEDKLACFEQNYPLSKYVEMSPITPDCEAIANAKVSYVNCRAVSPRRVDVHGCVAVIFSLLCCESTDFLCSASGAGAQLKLEPMNTCSAVGCVSKLFQMSEVVPVNSSGSNIKSIIHSHALPVITETKAVSNKLLLKGELQLNVSMCCEDGSVVHTDHSMPISQIVELSGINDSCICEVKCCTSSLDVQLRPDENGNMCSVDAAVCVRADICGYKQLSCAYVEDMYCLKSGVELKTSAVETKSFIGNLDENFLVTFQPDFSGAEVGEIIDSWCDNVTCVGATSPDGVELGGTVTLCVLYLDKEGKPALAQRQNDYRFNKDYNSSGGRFVSECSVDACGVSVSGKGNSVNARIQLRAHGSVFEACGVTAVSSAELTDENTSAKPSCAITVYFGDSGERLWDIAKKYNTSQEAVSRRNSIKGDVLENETMLIIPQVN